MTLQREDIQGLVFHSYGRLLLARYIFLEFDTSAPPRAWLQGLAEQVSSGREQPRGRQREQALQVAFSASGLRALGLPEEVMATFLQEFNEGMAEPRRARSLGDTGGSAPECWQFGGPGSRPIHLALLLFASNEASLESLHCAQREAYTAAGVREVFCQQAELRPLEEPGHTPDSQREVPRFREAFGFVDGITRVAIATERSSSGTPPSSQVTEVPAGEVLLGHRNAYGRWSFSPSVPAAMDRHGLLPAARETEGRKDLGRNGSYLVLRKLRQDVRGFHQFLDEHAHRLEAEALGADPRELLAAKLMGRWRSGAPLARCPMRDDPELARDPQRNNDFSYTDDPQGLKCPISSHIRRSNPRDGLLEAPEDSLRVVDRHQILRRGRPYREQVPCGEPEEGLLFVALNSDLARQFEFIQQTWMNNPKFGGLRDSRDPIAGNNGDSEEGGEPAEACAVDIPARPFRYHFTGLKRFVHTRGGGYFFLPGLCALRFLATLQPGPSSSTLEHGHLP